MESISATTTISSPIADTAATYSHKTCINNHKINLQQQNQEQLNRKTGNNWVGCSIRGRVSQAL